jgi:hypothetical protein
VTVDPEGHLRNHVRLRTCVCVCVCVGGGGGEWVCGCVCVCVRESGMDVDVRAPQSVNGEVNMIDTPRDTEVSTCMHPQATAVELS